MFVLRNIFKNCLQNLNPQLLLKIQRVLPLILITSASTLYPQEKKIFQQFKKSFKKQFQNSYKK